MRQYYLLLPSRHALMRISLDESERGDSTINLPPEFSRANSEPLSYHFKIVCQLFVILALDVAANRQITMQEAMKGTSA